MGPVSGFAPWGREEGDGARGPGRYGPRQPQGGAAPLLDGQHHHGAGQVVRWRGVGAGRDGLLRGRGRGRGLALHLGAGQ